MCIRDSSKECSNGSDGKTVNDDENVHSVRNATDENNMNIKTEKDSKDYSNGLDGKTMNQDENVHSCGNLNATDENSGKTEKEQ